MDHHPLLQKAAARPSAAIRALLAETVCFAKEKATASGEDQTPAVSEVTRDVNAGQQDAAPQDERNIAKRKKLTGGRLGQNDSG